MELYHIDYQPRLMGANWFKVTTDDYIRHVYVNNYNANKDVVCNGIHGYGSPCPVNHTRKFSNTNKAELSLNVC